MAFKARSTDAGSMPAVTLSKFTELLQRDDYMFLMDANA